MIHRFEKKTGRAMNGRREDEEGLATAWWMVAVLFALRYALE